MGNDQRDGSCPPSCDGTIWPAFIKLTINQINFQNIFGKSRTTCVPKSVILKLGYTWYWELSPWNAGEITVWPFVQCGKGQIWGTHGLPIAVASTRKFGLSRPNFFEDYTMVDLPPFDDDCGYYNEQCSGGDDTLNEGRTAICYAQYSVLVNQSFSITVVIMQCIGNIHIAVGYCDWTTNIRNVIGYDGYLTSNSAYSEYYATGDATELLEAGFSPTYSDSATEHDEYWTSTGVVTETTKNEILSIDLVAIDPTDENYSPCIPTTKTIPKYYAAGYAITRDHWVFSQKGWADGEPCEGFGLPVCCNGTIKHTLRTRNEDGTASIEVQEYEVTLSLGGAWAYDPEYVTEVEQKLYLWPAATWICKLENQTTPLHPYLKIVLRDNKTYFTFFDWDGNTTSNTDSFFDYCDAQLTQVGDPWFDELPTGITLKVEHKDPLYDSTQPGVGYGFCYNTSEFTIDSWGNECTPSKGEVSSLCGVLTGYRTGHCARVEILSYSGIDSDDILPTSINCAPTGECTWDSGTFVVCDAYDVGDNSVHIVIDELDNITVTSNLFGEEYDFSGNYSQNLAGQDGLSNAICVELTNKVSKPETGLYVGKIRISFYYSGTADTGESNCTDQNTNTAVCPHCWPNNLVIYGYYVNITFFDMGAPAPEQAYVRLCYDTCCSWSLNNATFCMVNSSTLADAYKITLEIEHSETDGLSLLFKVIARDGSNQTQYTWAYHFNTTRIDCTFTGLNLSYRGETQISGSTRVARNAWATGNAGEHARVYISGYLTEECSDDNNPTYCGDTAIGGEGYGNAIQLQSISLHIGDIVTCDSIYKNLLCNWNGSSYSCIPVTGSVELIPTSLYSYGHWYNTVSAGGWGACITVDSTTINSLNGTGGTTGYLWFEYQDLPYFVYICRDSLNFCGENPPWSGIAVLIGVKREITSTGCVAVVMLIGTERTYQLRNSGCDPDEDQIYHYTQCRHGYAHVCVSDPVVHWLDEENGEFTPRIHLNFGEI